MNEILKKRINNIPYRVTRMENGANDAYNEGDNRMDNIQLINDDCIHAMDMIDDKSIDCIISDPPIWYSKQK